MKIEDLLDIEAIRMLRMRYSYNLDICEVDGLVDLFTDDAVCEFGPFGTWNGKNEIGSNFEKAVVTLRERGPLQSLHVNTNHSVELTGPNTALGRVYLIDLAVGDADKNPLVWLGIYDEAYRKIMGQWKIERSSLQFLWPERHLTRNFRR